MSSEPAILIVSTHKPLLTLCDKALQGTTATVTQVATDRDSLLRIVQTCETPVVVLHERQGSDEWLSLAAALSDRPGAVRVVAIGESTDVGRIARAIVHGVQDYLPFSSLGDSPSLTTFLTNAITNTPPPADALYGRIKSMLPTGPFASGRYRSADGPSLSEHEAIARCMELGLTAEESARHLKTNASTASLIQTKAQRRPLTVPAILTVTSPRKLLWVIPCLALGPLIWLALSRPSHIVMPYAIAPTTGRITLDGLPLAKGIVRFTPDDTRGAKGPAGVGQINSEGRFRITTAGHDGAVVGHHRIVVLPRSIPASGDDGLDGIPEMYCRESTSGLTADISIGTTNTVDLSLLTPPAQTPVPAPQSSSPRR